MHKIVGAVLAFAVAALGALVLASYVRSKALHVEGPPPAPVQPLPPLEAQESTIILPVQVAISAVQDALNRALPRNGTSRKDDFAGNALKDDYIQFNWSRGDVALSASGGGLRLAAPAAGDAHAEGKLVLLKVSGNAKVKGSAALTISPELMPNWRVDPRAGGFEINLEQARIEIGPVKLSARDLLSDMARAEAQRRMPELNNAVRNNPFLEEAARREWGKLCRSFRIEPGGNPPAPAFFVEVRPREAIASQLRIEGPSIRMALGLRAQLRVTDAATNPNCAFPANLSLQDLPERGPLSIALPIEIAFPTLSQALNTAVANRTESRGGYEMTVRNVSVSAFGSRLLVAAEVEAKADRFFGARASGTVYAVGEPVLDPDAQQLTFRNIALDVKSRNALVQALGDGAAAIMEAALQRNARIDLRRELDKVKAQAEAAVGKLNASSDIGKLDVVFERLALTALAFDAERVRLVAQASGTVRGEVMAIPLP